MPTTQEEVAPIPDARLAASRAFVMDLARALLVFGTPAHRLEEGLTLVSRRLGMGGEFFSVPTAVIASFQHGSFEKTHLVRAEPGEVNLEKLVLLNDLTEQVLSGAITPTDGTNKVREILAAPPRFGPFAVTFCYALASASISTFFGGNSKQVAAAGVIGLLVGVLQAIIRPFQSLARLYEVIAAAVASFLAYAAIELNGANAVYLTTVAGLIVLVPGLTLTVGLTELATVNLVSGTARLMGAGVTFLKLALGVAIGGRIGSALFGAAASAELPGAVLWIQATSLLCASLAFTVLFQAAPRDAGWIVVASLLSIVGSRVGTMWLGPQLGQTLGAFLGTVGCNVYARTLHRPARVPLTPSILMLVPGSIGFRSVALLLDNDTLSGVDTAFRMALAAIALVAGVLFASLLVPPRRLL